MRARGDRLRLATPHAGHRQRRVVGHVRLRRRLRRRVHRRGRERLQPDGDGGERHDRQGGRYRAGEAPARRHERGQGIDRSTGWRDARRQGRRRHVRLGDAQGRQGGHGRAGAIRVSTGERGRVHRDRRRPRDRTRGAELRRGRSGTDGGDSDQDPRHGHRDGPRTGQQRPDRRRRGDARPRRVSI